jgi:hypothetical protein
LYCVDGKTLLHVNSAEGLLAALNNCRFRPKANQVEGEEADPYSWQAHADYIRPLIQP